MQILQSKIILAKNINIDKNYINVIDYSESNMVSLVSSESHLVAQKNDYQFIRNNGTIYVDIPYATCLQANYIAFQNKDYSNKWFFAWIDEVIFNSDKNAEIRYTIDQWSTWHDYWTQKPCYVQREHVNDDTIGLHTVPENLDVGEVIEEDSTDDSSFNHYLWIVIESEFNPETKRRFNGVSVVNGNFQAFPYYFIKYYFPMDTSAPYSNLANFLLCVASGGGSNISDILTGNIEYIKNIFIVPQACINEGDLDPVTVQGNALFNTFSYFKCTASLECEEFTQNITKLTIYTDGQTTVPIRNNKCYCYPYNYLLVSNNIGNQNIYKYEDFSNPTTATFKFIGSVCIGASGKMLPMNYKGMLNDFDESIPLPKYPVCSWSSDAFTNWLTQNAINMSTNIVGIGANYYTAEYQMQQGEVSSGSILGAPMSIASGVMRTIGAFHSASLLPNIQGGQNTADVNFSSGINTFVFHRMRCKTEYLLRIDDFFTRFGYKIDRVKNANLTGRSIFNYVEIGSNESIGQGTLPSQAMETINNAFRKGVTIWHNHANIGNYNLDNSII